MSAILGISAFYHDSAATLLKDGKIIAAAQEERFTRIKHDERFPKQAIEYVLAEGKIKLRDIKKVIFYEKPFLKFERLLETYMAFAPRGFKSFALAMPLWLREKLFQKKYLFDLLQTIDKEFKNIDDIKFTEHHHSHAASAFYPSPFKEAIILTMDGVGEWATSTVAIGNNNKIKIVKEIHFPHSLGLLYSAFTYYTGFKVNGGEYKLMGLAPYGEPKYYDKIIKELIDLKEDGSFKLDQKYFNYATGLTMTNSKFDNLFGEKPRKKNEEIKQFHMDIAASIQKVTEDVMIKITKSLRNEFKIPNLCLAGGVALNCVANGKISKNKIFENIWIQPAAGDAGGSLGAALAFWHEVENGSRIISNSDSMSGSYLGPEYSDEEIKKQLDKIGAVYKSLDENEIINITAKHLTEGKTIGWFQGRMEFGPRALGNRSIIADPRSSTMQKNLNLKIKFRESFRPFAPSVLEEKVNEWFDYDDKSPYMLMVAKVKKEKQKNMSVNEKKLFGIDQLNVVRSEVPAITHVDFSARIQTVNKINNKKYYNLIKEFDKLTGVPILVNTSFNIRGEPIVSSVEDAYRCFLTTDLDYLVCGNQILEKEVQ
ncbi:MAG: carbamoyltransferase [Pseudomonadota bacterium]|nr:carbamoyltransferase [Pseudomonadota bacterium]